ncbi:MAG: translation initiation factor IF-2 [Candidatus Nitrospinota bacterium M3_3B_026]
MSGIRVHEIAKETGIPSKKLIEVLSAMGYPVKSHSSSIDSHLADRLRKQVKKMGLLEKAGKKPKKAKPAAAKKTAKPAAAKKTAKPAAKMAGPVANKKAPSKKAPAEKEKAAEEKKTPVKAAPVKKEEKPKEKQAPPSAEKEELKKREEEKAAREAAARRREEAERKRLQAERERKRQEQREREQSEARKRKKEQEKKRKEEEKKREEAERERKRREREEREARRRREQEEREIQRLIDEEEREKREAERRRIVIDEATTVKEMAEKLRVGVNDIISKLIGKGIMATLNQSIDTGVAKELAQEMGYEIVTREEEETEEAVEEIEDKEKLQPRAPVVTIMGHVDHGKTSLLDTIRKTRVTEEEAGGITQRIGAYKVKIGNGAVVFLDTPGHEAFTTMRSRGAAVTDIVVLVVAADDGVKPQTVEAIHHARAAGVPVLVAVNKIDKPGANPDKVKQELTAHDLVPEQWGGETIFCEVSAKENIGTENLLEMLSLQSEILELKANPDRPAFGAVVESKLDKGRGPVATVLIQKGTLKVGDPFVAGLSDGKVRAMIDDKGHRIDAAGPSTPVEVLGFSRVPEAGESFMVVESDRKASQLAQARQRQARESGLTSKGHVKLESLHAQITKGEVKDLNIVIKADTQGSIEAISKALEDIHVESVRIKILHAAAGGITETDIGLADASDAIVIGFNVRPTEKARAQAQEQGVDVRLYSVIYNAIDDIRAALEGMLEPEYEEKVTGRAQVREIFKISRVGTIAGCMVLSGKISRGSQVRLVRDDVVIYTGKIDSLKRFKEDAKEVATGYECGVGLENYDDMKISDVIETFVVEPVPRKAAAGA